METAVAIDTETTLISPEEVAPRLICMTCAMMDPTRKTIETALYGNDAEGLEEIHSLMVGLLDDDDVLLVFHNAAFDLTVLVRAFPSLIPLIFEKLSKGLITDTKIREKLMNLADHGHVAKMEAPDGTTTPIRYSLNDLLLKYFGEDRSDEKQGTDVWRMNYVQMDRVNANRYPQGAADYAMQDAADTLRVYNEQAEEVRQIDHGDVQTTSVATEGFQTAVDFALRLMTVHGFAIDPEAVKALSSYLEGQLSEDNAQQMIEAKILRPASPPRAYKNNPEKLTKGKPASINKAKLSDIVHRLYLQEQMKVPLTDTGRISTSKETLDAVAHRHPALVEYQAREKVKKLSTTYLPVFETALAVGTLTVHGDYDILKETGRTSSYGGKLYPSTNMQNVDPRVRGCYVPRPNYVLCSVDYEGIDLACFGQQCYELFGHSVHRDKINEGVNLHSYLGAQLAAAMAPDDEFTDLGDPMENYRAFLEMHDRDPKWFKHWRKDLAKPIGLGLPGGMGASTMAGVIRNAGVEVTEDEVQQMIQVWKDTYPEAVEYFKYVTDKLPDRRHSLPDDPRFAYTSPMRMHRAGARYAAACNGSALQTRAAEGAKGAVFDVAQECYDVTRQSPLYGCRPVAFIHDEIIVELPRDGDLHDLAHAIADTMVRAMERVVPDVTVRAEPALMLRWDKDAEPTFGPDGRLTIWTPPEDRDDGNSKGQGAA